MLRLGDTLLYSETYWCTTTMKKKKNRRTFKNYRKEPLEHVTTAIKD